jgi:uncharacterized protein YkwD
MSARILLAAALAAACLVVLTGCSQEQVAEVTTYSGINAMRKEHGLPPLQADAGLVQAARIRSQDMASKGYFSHDPPDGCNFACLIDEYEGSHGYAGENIAWNTFPWSQSATVAVLMWENSPEHLANILNCHYERVGSGVARAADGKIYYTMLFDGMRSC